MDLMIILLLYRDVFMKFEGNSYISSFVRSPTYLSFTVLGLEYRIYLWVKKLTFYFIVLSKLLNFLITYFFQKNKR
jgi:hypothetical protein